MWSLDKNKVLIHSKTKNDISNQETWNREDSHIPKTEGNLVQFAQASWYSSFSRMAEELIYNPALAYEWAQDEE